MPKPRRKANGTWTLVVQFSNRRRNLTLGKLPKREIDHFVRNVQMLVEHGKHGGKSLPPQLMAWVGDLNERHKEQLSDLGLFDYSAVGTVGELMDAYLAQYEQSSLADSTKKKVRSTINNRVGRLRFVKLSNVEPVLRSVRVNADPVFPPGAQKILTDFNSWQRNHYAPATWTRDNKLFSSVGIWAVSQGICDHNPFGELPTASMVNDERNAYIPVESVLDAMNACLSPDIRVTLALGRFAGFRTCSEVRTLKWSMVDASAGTLTLIDSKKKRPRVMPLFENIAQELERQRVFTGDTRFVASSAMRGSSSAANYRKIVDAISRSGQDVWPRARQNLRASCENDLLALFEERQVTAWIGHTVKVSRDHYQKQRPSDYRDAIKAAADANL